MVDDGLVILATICLLTNNVLYTATLPQTYTLQNVRINHFPKPHNYQEIADSYAKYTWAGAYLFFTNIWAVKGSFLAYYEDLTKRLTSFRRAWWLTIVFTILTYLGSLFAYGFLDGNGFKTNLRNEAIKYQFAADLSTDVFSTYHFHSSFPEDPKLMIRRKVAAIPLLIALRSQIPVGQKLALAGVFSLNLIITIFSIIRFTLITPNRGTAGPSWSDLWSVIEQSISVAVACLASFRIFVIHKRRRGKNSSSRGRVKDSSTSSSQKVRFPPFKIGFSDLRSHWSNPSVEPRDDGSMEFQLLDAAPLKSPAQAAASLKHGESTHAF